MSTTEAQRVLEDNYRQYQGTVPSSENGIVTVDMFKMQPNEVEKELGMPEYNYVQSNTTTVATRHDFNIRPTEGSIDNIYFEFQFTGGTTSSETQIPDLVALSMIQEVKLYGNGAEFMNYKGESLAQYLLAYNKKEETRDVLLANLGGNGRTMSADETVTYRVPIIMIGNNAIIESNDEMPPFPVYKLGGEGLRIEVTLRPTAQIFVANAVTTFDIAPKIVYQKWKVPSGNPPCDYVFPYIDLDIFDTYGINTSGSALTANTESSKFDISSFFQDEEAVKLILTAVTDADEGALDYWNGTTCPLARLQINSKDFYLHSSDLEYKWRHAEQFKENSVYPLNSSDQRYYVIPFINGNFYPAHGHYGSRGMNLYLANVKFSFSTSTSDTFNWWITKISKAVYKFENGKLYKYLKDYPIG